MSSVRIHLPFLAAVFAAPLALACDRSARPAETATSTSTTTATPASTVAPSPSGPTVVTEETTATVPINVSYGDAETAFRRGQYDEATDLFAAYVGGHPENPWGHYMYGLSAWKSGEHERAIEAFDQALTLDPNHRKSLLNSARVLLETSRPREALERVERALAIEPLSSDGLRLLGRARHELGEVPEAIDAYQRALAIDDHDAWSMNNLGLIYIQQSRFAEALRPLARAVELRPNSPVFQNNLGMALERSGRPQAARQAYASALEADTTYEKASASLNRLGGPTDPADTTATVDLGSLAREFEGQVESWRDTVGVMARDSASVE
jgi:predicted Zn-dependent protease